MLLSAVRKAFLIPAFILLLTNSSAFAVLLYVMSSIPSIYSALEPWNTSLTLSMAIFVADDEEVVRIPNSNVLLDVTSAVNVRSVAVRFLAELRVKVLVFKNNCWLFRDLEES